MLTETLRRVGPVEGVGISRIDFSFKIFEAKDVLVIRTTNGVDRTLKLMNDYSVTFDKDQVAKVGGYVTLVDFLQSDEKITLLSNVEYSQNLDLHAEGDFNPQDINTELDRHVAQIQQLNEKLSRAAVVPASRDKTGEEWGDELVTNSERSKEYAEKAHESAVAAAASAAVAQEAQANLDASTDLAVNAYRDAQNAAAGAALSQELAEAAANRAEETRQYVESAAFSYRYCANAEAYATVNSSSIEPSTYLKVGDHIVNAKGEVFSIETLASNFVVLSAKLTSIEGPQGAQGETGNPGKQGPVGATFTPAVSDDGTLSWTNDRGLVNPESVNIKGPQGEPGKQGEQGEPGPKGEQGDPGPMGSSPWAAAFGQFRLDGPCLMMDYVGVEPATNFHINDNGELEAEV